MLLVCGHIYTYFSLEKVILKQFLFEEQAFQWFQLLGYTRDPLNQQI